MVDDDFCLLQIAPCAVCGSRGCKFKWFALGEKFTRYASPYKLIVLTLKM
jgi:hypothetical protein